MGRMKERWMTIEMVGMILNGIIDEDYRLHAFQDSYGEILDVYDALEDLEPMGKILTMPIVERCPVLKDILVEGV